MISDKLQTAFNRAVVPEMNCYFCYQPLFSFYQGTVEIMRHGVILRLRHLRFWLICHITWNTNINKQTKKKTLQLRAYRVWYARRNLSASSVWPVIITITKPRGVYYLRLSGSSNDLSLWKKRFNMSHLELLEKCLQQLIVKRTSRVNRECQTSNSYSVNSLETREHHFFARSSEWPWVF